NNEVLSLRSPDITVYKGDLKPNGQLEFGEVVDLYDENSEVKVSYEIVNDETKLKFSLEDPSQLYKIIYQTEVTAKPEEGNASNSIRLVGENGQTIDNIEATSQIGVGDNDVGGGAGRNGILDIIKKDPDDEPLNGVCFA